MTILFRCMGVVAIVAALASCASSSSADNERPRVYRGGQYYGDAWHSDSRPQ